MKKIIIPLLLVICFGLSSCSRKEKDGEHTQPSTIKPSGQTMDLQGSFISVADTVKPAVVNISAIRVEKSESSLRFRSPFSQDPFEDFFRYFFSPETTTRQYRSIGTGIIIDPRGHILTNYHVVEGAKDIRITLDDGKERKTFTASILGTDPYTDLCVIKIEGQVQKGFRFPVVILGDSDRIRVGEWAIAIGSPFGLEHTVTVGVISAKRQNFSVEGRNYEDLIQTDASINPGNSGGPLVNIRGEVIGINVAIYTPSGGFVGVGFAIPINKAKKVLAGILNKNDTQKGWLGVKIQEVTPELAKALDLEMAKGVLISDILVNSPAQKGGLLRGDVITVVNGEEIIKPSDLQKTISKLSAGAIAKTEIIRKGRQIQLSIVLGQVPSN